MFGGGLLGIGIFILVSKNDILVLTRSVDTSNLDVPSLIEKAAYAIIAGGAFIFIVAFLGCCGACRKSKGMLCTYAIVVGLILALEIAAVVMAIVYKSDVSMTCFIVRVFEKFAKDNLTNLLETRYIGPYDFSDVISLAFDLVHILFGCCGVTSGAQFANISSWNTTYAYDDGSGSYVIATAVIPATCCDFSNDDAFPNDITNFLLSMTNTTCPVTKANSYYEKGCYDELYNAFSTYFNIVIGFGASVGALEILGIISACCLMKKNEDEDKIGDSK
ncbi:hypothetical protein FSP39_008621 [Pinctada imbricata]|uniref:Tetraspanin n=1 Tax=Pinctada imbricata TaxID=66713 RepID=A0AA89BYR3_PINIB|nr:hypothetical protein FSP39_008621 [Pinctada imbricata]